jgi:hypothetical protein
MKLPPPARTFVFVSIAASRERVVSPAAGVPRAWCVSRWGRYSSPGRHGSWWSCAWRPQPFGSMVARWSCSPARTEVVVVIVAFRRQALPSGSMVPRCPARIVVVVFIVVTRWGRSSRRRRRGPW